MVKNPRFRPWETEKIGWLKQNYNEDYSELESYLGKTRRAIKHKVAELGLERQERRRWSDEEVDILKKNPNLSAKELAVKLGRSEYQVAYRLRGVRGSANRRFKEGWDVPSRDLAYFLGAVCSDIGIYDYTLEFTQQKSGREMFLEVVRILRKIFGFNPTLAKKEVDYNKKGIIIKKEYDALWVSSNQFLLQMGTEGGIVAKNIRGSSGEWVDFLDEKFSWVWQDPYFWSFIGGLYDGDGSLSRIKSKSMKCGIFHEISIAVKPIRCRERLMKEFAKQGFKFIGGEFSIRLKGGQEKMDIFLQKVDCMILTKREKYED